MAASSSLNSKLIKACKNGDLDLVTSLISRGADINYKDSYGDSSLHVAAFHGYDKIVSLLIFHGADINSEGFWGRSPLHYTACYGYDSVAKVLIFNGTDINCKKSKGNNFEATKILLDNYVDFSIIDHGGRTALDIACSSMHSGIYDLIKNHMKNESLQQKCSRVIMKENLDSSDIPEIIRSRFHL